MQKKDLLDPKENEEQTTYEEFSPSSQYQNSQQLMNDYYNKLQKRKKIENWILISSIAIIGVYFAWILALYWIISFRNTNDEFYSAWRNNPSFKGSFPFQPELHVLLANDKIFYEKMHKANNLKLILLIILALPFIGWFIIFTIFLISFGVVPIFLYYYIKSPTRYISNQIRTKDQLMGNEERGGEALSFFKKNGSISYDFSTISQIMRGISLNESEEVLGIFQISERPIKPPFMIITNQQILKFSPAYIADFGEKLIAVRKNQIASYYIEKGTFLAKLIIESTGGWNFVFRNINKSLVPPITKAMNLLQKNDIKTVEETKPLAKKTITKISEPFFCQVCESSRPATHSRMKCDTCNRFVCFDCFSEMVNVGKTDCPMCGGKLYSQ